MKANPRILLIDDEQEHLWLAERYLRRHGYNVLILPNLEDLLDNIRVFSPGIIFLEKFSPAAARIEDLIATDEYANRIPRFHLMKTALLVGPGPDGLITETGTILNWLEEMKRTADRVVGPH